MREVSYSEALNEALSEEMQRDADVILLGEEIGVYGGAYNVTEGLLGRFGSERVRDTPISEIAIVGAALGAALEGLRPVAEIMYMDFLTISTEQLVNQAAKAHFMSGGQLNVPLVVRTQYSLGRVHGSQHSQFFPSWFLQVPGLKVALPSNPADAKGLLKSSIRDDNPVLFVESGVLYSREGEVPDGEHLVPLGEARVVGDGRDVTIISYSRAVEEALKATELLEKSGVGARVVDIRTATPLDVETIVESIQETYRAVVVGDDPRSGSLAAHISSVVMEEAFDYLDAPVRIVSSPDISVPFSPPLEEEYMPSAEDVVEAVSSMTG